MHQRPDQTLLRRTVLGRMTAAMFGASLAVVFVGCGHSQVGSDEAALKTVDALYTAISTRRADLLESCAAQVDELHTGGRIPDAAFHQLKPIIAEARSGQWDAALRKLYDFMRGQRKTLAKVVFG